MNAKIDVKNSTEWTPICQPETADDFLESATLHTDSLASILVTISGYYGERNMSNDRAKACLAIAINIAKYMLEDISKAVSLTTIDLSEIHEKAINIKITIEEVSKLRMNDKYNCGCIEGLFNVVERFKDELNDSIRSLLQTK